MTTTLKRLIDELYSCNNGLLKISRVLNHRYGGLDVGDFTATNCTNHLMKACENNVGWHRLKVLKYFQRKVGIEV